MKTNRNAYIYSIHDFEEAMERALDKELGCEISRPLIKKVLQNVGMFANLYRFYDRNCPGCVSGNDECDFAEGRNEGFGAISKAVKGELFDCPVRINGTLMSTTSGLKRIDISDRDKAPYPVVAPM